MLAAAVCEAFEVVEVGDYVYVETVAATFVQIGARFPIGLHKVPHRAATFKRPFDVHTFLPTLRNFKPSKIISKIFGNIFRMRLLSATSIVVSTLVQIVTVS